MTCRRRTRFSSSDCERPGVPIGKTNVPEFGMGSHTYNKVYGTTVNPYDLTKSAGGSSGGAGAALAPVCSPLLMAATSVVPCAILATSTTSWALAPLWASSPRPQPQCRFSDSW